MNKGIAHKEHPMKIALWLAVETAIYGAFIVGYYFAVLLPLRGWLKHLFDAHKDAYALVTLPLIIAQAALLHLV
ncbi:MAG TPA: hypothetical protein VMJ12_11355, partial [Candidatus Acidoferrales bacterium]|nr:hypothetical protein [Candidatus Acidoferrales bacterium]